MVDRFLSRCLLCHHVKVGRVVNRPWSETFRSIKRNEAIHWDYLYLGDSFGDSKYLLVVKDDLTHYCELVPCAQATSMVTAEAILDWHSRFGAPKIWISDNGSHFKNEVMNQVCKRMGCRQSFTLAYSPWINGSVERVNRDIIQVFRVLCLEHKVDIRDWTYFVPIVQANLNHTPLPSLGNHAPVELFCGLPTTSPIDFCLDTRSKKLIELKLEDVDSVYFPQNIQKKLESLRNSLTIMHRKVSEEREKQTKRNKKNQKAARMPNFEVGDFVLRSRVDQIHQDKLLVTWIGPYQIIGAEEHSFKVQHVITGAKSDVHASRLKFYADKSFEVTEEIREHVAAQGIVLSVAELKEHRWNESKGEHEMLVSWKGLDPIEDSWESVRSLVKDIPVMVKRYASASNDDSLIKIVNTN